MVIYYRGSGASVFAYIDAFHEGRLLQQGDIADFLNIDPTMISSSTLMYASPRHVSKILTFIMFYTNI